MELKCDETLSNFAFSLILRLKCDDTLSSFGFNFILRRSTKVTNPECLRSTLDDTVMTVSLSAATAKRELAFLFAGRVAPR